MSHYGKGLIVVTALVVGVAAAQSGVGGNVTFDSTKGAVPEFSDEERGRIFDEVMRISEAPVSDMTAPEVAELFAGGSPNAGVAHGHHPRDSAGSRA